MTIQLISKRNAKYFPNWSFKNGKASTAPMRKIPFAITIAPDAGSILLKSPSNNIITPPVQSFLKFIIRIYSQFDTLYRLVVPFLTIVQNCLIFSQYEIHYIA